MGSASRWATLSLVAILALLACAHAAAADWDGYDWETDASMRMEAQPGIQPGARIELYDAGSDSTHLATVETVIPFDESLLILELYDHTLEKLRTIEFYL
ncbi:hypothetical protein HPA02_34860 [Bisbaumannia pacifica]|uniref:Uncharacterized protein n=1 Tax=Bisbaumannia pacifica TaxID=77098 RepID=A0A510XCU2_9GAMM|nr:hypothetical protein [Halomonas pacifica]GEK49203.1 hypothetical protein HPA02_34860 [Halomonas pacifica]